MKVENLALNQFIIYLDNCTAFQSYDSLIAVQKDGLMYVGEKWDYSKTTLKYFKQFINTDKSKKDLEYYFNLHDDYFKFISNEQLERLIRCQNES